MTSDKVTNFARKAAMSGNSLHEDAEREKAGLDPASWTTIFRFACTVVLFLVWLAPRNDWRAGDALATALLGAAIVTELLAFFLHEPFRGPSLNRWDEALAYLGIAALVSAVS